MTAPYIDVDATLASCRQVLTTHTLRSAEREIEQAQLAARELLRAARLPNAAVINDPATGQPLRVEVPFDEWQDFRAAWRAAGGRP